MKTTLGLLSLVAFVTVLVPARGAALQQSVASVASPPPLARSKQYVVRFDPRLCPSPLCGGYWVSLANRARTRCHDGLSRPRCYVAGALDADGQQLKASIPDGALARATIGTRPFEGFGELGILVVAEVSSPLGRTSPTGRFFRLVDTGIRCVRAPCFAIRISQLNRSARTTVSGIDIDAAGTTAGERARVERALATKAGVLAQGHVVPSADGGRVLRATRFFLRSQS